MHGASGVPDKQIRAAIKYGVCVFNIDTDLRVAFNKALRANIAKNPQIYDPRKLFRPATDALQAMAETKLKLMYTSGKAKGFKMSR
jgi:fructose-bisphosphate aldolase class II